MNNYTAQFDIRPASTRTVFRRSRETMPTARFYGSSNLIDATDEVGLEAGVFVARFKSAAWSKFTQAASRLTIKALRDKLDLSKNVSVTFSHYAGCSMCPCSPGFVIRAKNNEGAKELCDKELARTSIYGKIMFANEVVKDFKLTNGTEFLVKFAAEKEQNEQQLSV